MFLRFFPILILPHLHPHLLYAHAALSLHPVPSLKRDLVYGNGTRFHEEIYIVYGIPPHEEI